MSRAHARLKSMIVKAVTNTMKGVQFSLTASNLIPATKVSSNSSGRRAVRKVISFFGLPFFWNSSLGDRQAKLLFPIRKLVIQ